MTRQEFFPDITLYDLGYKESIDERDVHWLTNEEYMTNKTNDKTQAMIYTEVARLAMDTVHEVMRAGEADNKSGWEECGIHSSLAHAENHLECWEYNQTPEEHLRHALTRCAMAYYLWKREHPE